MENAVMIAFCFTFICHAISSILNILCPPQYSQPYDHHTWISLSLSLNFFSFLKKDSLYFSFTMQSQLFVVLFFLFHFFLSFFLLFFNFVKPVRNVIFFYCFTSAISCSLYKNKNFFLLFWPYSVKLSILYTKHVRDCAYVCIIM